MATFEELFSSTVPDSPLPVIEGALGEYIPSTVHCEFVTGGAGTGKTTLIRKRLAEDMKYGVLCATTGIAAINLGEGITTLNSLLKFFDTDSLRDKFDRGSLTTALHRIGKNTKRLIIDEVSMLDAAQLDYLFQAMQQANNFKDMLDDPMGIVLTGDFCQLPPVKAKWAFEAQCWEHFERNTTRLTKVWRQDNQMFVDALNAARRGDGRACVDILMELGVDFITSPMKAGNGTERWTTIMAKNEQVDNFNFSELISLAGRPFGLNTKYWGEEERDWKKHIPEQLQLKIGAYVMILSNDAPEFTYVNGDCGTIEDVVDGRVMIRLQRNGQIVGIGPVVRNKVVRGKEIDDHPALPRDARGRVNAFHGGTTHVWCGNDCGHNLENGHFGTGPAGIVSRAPWGAISYVCNTPGWNVGGVKYFPLRLAYATTVHKSQGLTLDRVQIDCRDRFFSSPNMAYVALSRARTPDGMKIIGRPEQLAKAINVAGEVKKWL
jgi:ATP-dependent exoDNAse (exonuclease V) alpha subunit